MRLLDVFETPHLLCIVMPYLRGGAAPDPGDDDDSECVDLYVTRACGLLVAGWLAGGGGGDGGWGGGGPLTLDRLLPSVTAWMWVAPFARMGAGSTWSPGAY